MLIVVMDGIELGLQWFQTWALCIRIRTLTSIKANVDSGIERIGEKSAALVKNVIVETFSL